MKKQVFLGVLAACLLAPAAGMAQQTPVRVAAGDGIEVKGVEVQTQKTPLFQAGGVKDKNVKTPRDWLEIEVEFEAAKVDPRNGVIPELLFRYYVAVKGPEAPKVLTCDVTHLNVQDGQRGLYSAVYVSPSTLGKITGDFSRFQESSVEGVGVEILFNGVIVGGYSSTNGKFWEAAGYSPQPGVLPKWKSPFALLWLDRYADSKETD